MGENKILVIGGCGYIGTHMVKGLLEDGSDVITLDNLSTGHLGLLPGGMFIKGDAGNKKLLNEIFNEYKVNCVIHFAAHIEVRESFRFPIKYYQNNLSATINLLEAMIQNRVNKLIFSSTAAVYGEPLSLPIDESHPCRPTSPYGRTKYMVEEILSDLSDTYKEFRYIILRYFNASGADSSGTIGEHHVPESHLIPLVLKVAQGLKENITIFGKNHKTPDGTCIRDYIHVNDIVYAHLLAMNALLNRKTNSAYNLGNGEGYSVYKVIETARSVTGRKIPIKVVEQREDEPAVLVASSEKAKKELQWEPKLNDLSTIIESAWKWHLNNRI
jgi:UDP-glucose 4-epimerase